MSLYITLLLLLGMSLATVVGLVDMIVCQAIEKLSSLSTAWKEWKLRSDQTTLEAREREQLKVFLILFFLY